MSFLTSFEMTGAEMFFKIRDALQFVRPTSISN